MNYKNFTAVGNDLASGNGRKTEHGVTLDRMVMKSNFSDCLTTRRLNSLLCHSISQHSRMASKLANRTALYSPVSRVHFRSSLQAKGNIRHAKTIK